MRNVLLAGVAYLITALLAEGCAAPPEPDSRPCENVTQEYVERMFECARASEIGACVDECDNVWAEY